MILRLGLCAYSLAFNVSEVSVSVIQNKKTGLQSAEINTLLKEHTTNFTHDVQFRVRLSLRQQLYDVRVITDLA